MSRYNYRRRVTDEVKVGCTAIGGENPVRLQSMTNTSTNDVEGSAAQARRIADAGGEIVRLTTQGVREARSLGEIRRRLEAEGCDVPLVADVHFNPNAALEAAVTAHKVRINPGNFTDAARIFRHLEYTDEEYRHELDRIDAALRPLIALCREHGTALRLGVNHGSLSDRIMSRYGDTPAGMAESVMEYLRACRSQDFNQIVISIKASNPVVMTQTVKLLCSLMDREGMRYPLHLGVTEAGNGEDGRVKSAVGIGCLMAEGIGDTIRVSLSEAPENEIPVAKLLRDYICSREGHRPVQEPQHVPTDEERGDALPLEGWNGKGCAVVGLDIELGTENLDTENKMPADWQTVDASAHVDVVSGEKPVVVYSKNQNAPGEIAAFIDRLRVAGKRNAVVARLAYNADTDYGTIAIKAGADLGFLLLNGYLQGFEINAPHLEREQINHLALTILQAARERVTRTDYIACPGCGRTLFDLEDTLAKVRESTKHLKGLRIGVMGCIVNGPGEMADADYGYVGAGRGRVSLYKNKELIEKNIPAEEAVDHLVALIKKNGDWKEA